MSLYTDVRDLVYTWTNKPALTAETDAAIRQALRSAHKAASFWRDLVVLPLTAQPILQVQTIDLSAVAPDFKQMATVIPTGYELQYTPVNVLDLFDQDKFYRTDVYYGIGTNLMIRAASPVDSITLTYYRYPTTNPITSIDSWIANYHQDLIALWASSTILGMIGEQEIKGRVDALALLALADLKAEALQINRN